MNFSTATSPKALTVIPHYAFAALAFLVLNFLLFFSREALVGHYFHPKLLAITHLTVLGWGVMVIFGALYQLLPVILNVSLYSERFAKITFFMLATGTILLAVAFWHFEVGLLMQLAALLVFSSFTLFTFNIYLTIKKAKEWKNETDFILTACIWLFLTGLAGVMLVFNFRYPFLPESHLSYLKLHAHLGIVGWFLLLIIGVASRLLPMFMLTHHTQGKVLSYSYYLINAGLLGFIFQQCVSIPSAFVFLWIALVALGILCFGFYCFDAFKNRFRKEVDHPMKLSLTAISLLLLPMLLVLVLNSLFPFHQKVYLQLSLAYGFSIFMGFITALILGQTFKTLPFIVWMHTYQKWVGKEKTPLPKDLFSSKIVLWQNFSYLAGFVILLIGIITSKEQLLRIGGLLLVLTALFYVLNVYKILIHLALKNKKYGRER